MGVGMVGIAVNHSSPFDRRSGKLLDPCHHLGRGSLEVHVCIFWRQDDFENSLVSSLLPAFGHPPELVLLCQSKPVGIGRLAFNFGGRFPLRWQAVALGTLPLYVGSMRLPSPWRPGGRIADINDGAALEGRRFRGNG